MWSPFSVTCIENVFESDVFDENIQSLFSSDKVLNVSVVPILHGESNQVSEATNMQPLNSSFYEQSRTSSYDPLGYLLLINNQHGAKLKHAATQQTSKMLLSTYSLNACWRTNEVNR